MDSSKNVTIRAAGASDAPSIAAIYNHYAAETVVTFEEESVTEAEMARRVTEVQSTPLPWLVAEEGDAVVGYAYAMRWRARVAYRRSVETTVYLAPEQGGRGVGSKLYNRLFSVLRDRRFHVAIGGIALPNDASVALHEKFGMRKVAHFEQVGFKFDRWTDVGYWQRVL